MFLFVSLCRGNRQPEKGWEGKPLETREGGQSSVPTKVTSLFKETGSRDRFQKFEKWTDVGLNINNKLIFFLKEEHLSDVL